MTPPPLRGHWAVVSGGVEAEGRPTLTRSCAGVMTPRGLIGVRCIGAILTTPRIELSVSVESVREDTLHSAR